MNLIKKALLITILFLTTFASTNAQIATVTASTSTVSNEVLIKELNKILKEKYFGEVPATITAALNNSTSTSLDEIIKILGDKYTNFFDKKGGEQFKEGISGNFSGIGVEMAAPLGLLTIQKIFPNSPAQKVGLLVGDKIIQINGMDLAGMTMSDAIGKIRGLIGSTVTLGIARGDSTSLTQINVVRDKINIPVAEGTFRDDALVITFSSFTDDATDKFQKNLIDFQKSGKENLLIDLRDNGGGYLKEAVEIASLILPAKKVIFYEQFAKSKRLIPFYSKGYDVLGKNTKIILLVNRGTASASEILVGSLQGYKNVKVIGEKTFGKGSVQEIVDLPNGNSIKVTTAKWYTSKKKSIDGIGIMPDIKIDMASSSKESQLTEALKHFSLFDLRKI
jgi:carboxyl-terminal processing protease